MPRSTLSRKVTLECMTPGEAQPLHSLLVLAAAVRSGSVRMALARLSRILDGNSVLDMTLEITHAAGSMTQLLQPDGETIFSEALRPWSGRVVRQFNKPVGCTEAHGRQRRTHPKALSMNATVRPSSQRLLLLRQAA
ncbi:hypothetical protein MRX96_002459 [Rhipicephalus microplus]